MLSTCSIISRKNLNLKTKLEDILQSDLNSTLYLAPQLLDSDLPGAFLYGALPTHCLISSHKWTSPREWGCCALLVLCWAPIMQLMLICLLDIHVVNLLFHHIPQVLYYTETVETTLRWLDIVTWWVILLHQKILWVWMGAWMDATTLS